MKQLLIKGVIGRADDPTIPKGEKVFSLKDLENFIAVNGNEFEAVIDSPGGSVEEGFKIFDRLKSLQVDTVALSANSIASIIFLSGKNRRVYPKSEMIIHNAWVDAEAFAGEKLNVHTLNELADIFAETDEKILDVYAQFSGEENRQRIFALMASETDLGAELAFELGFATEVLAQEDKAKAFKNRVITYSQNQISLLNIQDGDIKTYADVVLFNSEDKVLMLQRKDDDDFEPNKWGFPGGKVMQGETTLTGAIRELNEETGIQLNYLEKVNEIVNDDESITDYFTGVTNESPKMIPEHKTWDWVNIKEIENLSLIKDQKDRFVNIINSIKTKNQMDQKEKMTTFEKMLNSLTKAFKRSFKNMVVSTADGVELFIEGEGDQQYVGKTAFISEEGIPTEATAPEGNHTLADGTVITVGEGGVISEAVEAANLDAIKEDYEEKMKSMEEEKKAMEEEKEELLAKITNLTEVNESNSKKVAELQKAFIDLKNQVAGDPEGKKEEVQIDFSKLSPAQKARLVAINKAKNQIK
jgi:ATP-dependent protease ClpP protease subunit/8-oxo-dGTP pyrophosphatase MutT (NUDIX family)